jgi:ankyrin repeat protein
MSELARLIEAAKQGDLESVKTVLRDNPELINQKDASGAAPLHYATFGGYRSVVQELVRRGVDVNIRDGRFGATPTGWAIEYLRELGGFLGIEMEDLAHAIRRGEVEWVTRFLRRFPALRGASDASGRSLKLLARESGHQEIADLFP